MNSITEGLTLDFADQLYRSYCNNRKIIQALKKKVSAIGVSTVAEKLGMLRGTLYFHLDESRAEHANLDVLTSINDAVKLINEEIIKKQQDLLNKTSD